MLSFVSTCPMFVAGTERRISLLHSKVMHRRGDDMWHLCLRSRGRAFSLRPSILQVIQKWEGMRLDCHNTPTGQTYFHGLGCKAITPFWRQYYMYVPGFYNFYCIENGCLHCDLVGSPCSWSFVGLSSMLSPPPEWETWGMLHNIQ